MRWASVAVRVSFLSVAIHLAPGVACAQVGVESKTNSAIVPAPRDGSAQKLHESFLERTAQGDIDLLFLGDSITQGWNDNPVWQRYYGPRKAANFGIGGDRTQHVLWRLDHGEVEGIAPRVVVLMIGTNNVNDNTPDEIAEGVETILDRLESKLPEAKVLLLGVFPRGKSRGQDLSHDEQHPRIGEINERIAAFGDRDAVTFLDIGESFLDGEGRIPRTLMPDFLHLSRTGYRIWAESIEPTLWDLLEESD